MKHIGAEFVGRVEDRTTDAIERWLRAQGNASLTVEDVRRGIYDGTWRVMLPNGGDTKEDA